MYGILNIYIKRPQKSLLKSLLNNNIEGANLIYSCYTDTIKRFVLYTRYALNLSSVIDGRVSFNDMFGETIYYGQKILWSTDKKNYQQYTYKARRNRGINPLLKSKNLISPLAWKKLQLAIQKQPLPNTEIEELLKFKTKAQWNEKRIAVVETMSIIELAIRDKIEKILNSKGLSIKRLKDMRKDIGISILLNILIPSAITKTDLKRYSKTIREIDDLRRIRNDIMHENLPEKSIDGKMAVRGISASIRLLCFLNKKFS